MTTERFNEHKKNHSDNQVEANHASYQARVDLYRSMSYDIPGTRERIAELLDGLAENAKILEVGTGKGHLAIAIASTGRSCVSIDVSEQEQQFALLNAKYYHVDDRIDFQIHDARELKFKDNQFDAILSATALHHIDETEPVLMEMLRVCKPGGIILLADLDLQGQEIVARVHASEGKVHTVLGWGRETIRKWFLDRGHNVSSHRAEPLWILKIRKKEERS